MIWLPGALCVLLLPVPPGDCTSEAEPAVEVSAAQPPEHPLMA